LIILAKLDRNGNNSESRFCVKISLRAFWHETVNIYRPAVWTVITSAINYTPLKWAHLFGSIFHFFPEYFRNPGVFSHSDCESLFVTFIHLFTSADEKLSVN